MKWRIGLVIATMAIALAGQALAVILVAPHDVRNHPRPRTAPSPSEASGASGAQQGPRLDGADRANQRAGSGAR
jgi:hypothetical protein